MGGVGRRSRRAMIAAWYGGARAVAVLSNPELLYAEPPLSTLTGLSYDSRASVLYEVGWRQTDSETGAFYGRDILKFFVRGIDTRTGQTTFMIVNGTDSKDILYAVTVDEKTSSLFVAGYTRGEFAVGGPGGNSWETEERERFYDFLVIAMDADGGMVWSYQDAGRLPSEDWVYSDNFQVNAFRAMAFDEPRGLLHLGGEGVGCLGEGCTLVTESISSNFVTVTLNASTGELVWQRQFIQGTKDYGSARAVAMDEASGVVFFGGSTSGNITQNDMSSGFEDMFIVALEAANGFIVWTRQIETTNDEAVLALAYGNDQGVLYACGYTTGNLTDEFPAHETSDVVVAAFDATDGETIWLRTFSSDLVDGDDIAYALTYVASGGVGSSDSEHFLDTKRYGLLHVSGSTNGKGFDSASGESLVDDSESTNARKTVFMTMTLDALDGAVISTYQSPDEDNPSAFYASILVSPEVNGDLYLGGIEGRGLLKSGVVYERHHPAPAPTLASTLPLTQTPTFAPSASPTSAPTSSPTSTPTLFPTAVSIVSPTISPTRAPVASPTSSPVIPPTNAPTLDPASTVSDDPFSTPNLPPTTSTPIVPPTFSTTSSPTSALTASPTRAPTTPPAQAPTLDPTSAASDGSTSTPNVSPIPAPFVSLTFAPTLSPTAAPTVSPTSTPTAPSTRASIASPTRVLTIPPSHAPTLGPRSTASDGPTSTPTLSPTFPPTVSPSSAPTASPTRVPTASPTPVPSILLTHAPTLGPTSTVSDDSTSAPSVSPTSAPTLLPSSLPTTSPARAPTVSPTISIHPVSKTSQHPVTVAPDNAEVEDDEGNDASTGGSDGDTEGSLDDGLRLVFVVIGSSITSTFICAVLVAVYRLMITQREDPTVPTTSAEWL